MIKTVSLEMAKALKDAGFKQDTDFAYSCNHFEEAMAINKDDAYSVHYKPTYRRDFAAPTSDEILEELPRLLYHQGLSYGLEMRRSDMFFYVGYKRLSDWFGAQESDKEFVEALSKLWLYLNKQGLNEKN